MFYLTKEEDPDSGSLYHLKCECSICGKVQDMYLTRMQYDSYKGRFPNSYPFHLVGWRDMSGLETHFRCPLCCNNQKDLRKENN